MSIEAPQKPTAEQISPTADEIAATFTEAQHSIYGLTNAPAFHARCLESGVDPNNDYDTAAYWDTVADYAYDSISRIRSQAGDSLHLSAFELLTATPAYIFAASNLERVQQKQEAGEALSPADQEQKQEDKVSASYFSSAIRNFAVAYPQTSAHKLSQSLVDIANKTISSPVLLRAGVRFINQTIHGAQHELAFGQMLSHTGRQFRPASLEEDLKGIDYVLSETNGYSLAVDVKSSMNKLLLKGVDGRPYTRGPQGQLLIYSLIKDSELGDRFFISNELAAQKAPAIAALLDEAQGKKAQAV